MRILNEELHDATITQCLRRVAGIRPGFISQVHWLHNQPLMWSLRVGGQLVIREGSDNVTTILEGLVFLEEEREMIQSSMSA